MSPLQSSYRRLLPEQRHPLGRRLGRFVRHDVRSLGFPVRMAPSVLAVRHERHVAIYDQGDLGMCTGTSCAGTLSTGPFPHRLTLADATKLYADATRLDSLTGTYPPDDTGSSGLAVMKAAQKCFRLIGSYRHAFKLEHALRALVLHPGITGFTWLESCDEPNVHGVVTYEGKVRGGHEVSLLGIDCAHYVPARLPNSFITPNRPRLFNEHGELDLDLSRVWFAQSWGPAWGDDGYFAMSIADYLRALDDDGDATFAELP